jgi:hypothetical protein
MNDNDIPLDPSECDGFTSYSPCCDGPGHARSGFLGPLIPGPLDMVFASDPPLPELTQLREQLARLDSFRGDSLWMAEIREALANKIKYLESRIDSCP